MLCPGYGPLVNRLIYEPCTSALVIKAPPGISKKDETATVTLTEHWAHLSRAVPEVIEQDAPQFLMYRTDSAFPDTSYPTKKMTVKYRYVFGLIVVHCIPRSTAHISLFPELLERLSLILTSSPSGVTTQKRGSLLAHRLVSVHSKMFLLAWPH